MSPASLTYCPSPANLFEVALLVGPLLGVLVVDDVQRRLPLLQLQAFDLRLQLVELLLQVFALLHVLHPKGDSGEGQAEALSSVCRASQHATETASRAKRANLRFLKFNISNLVRATRAP